MVTAAEVEGLTELSPHAREMILSIAQPVRFAEDEVIFRQGDHAKNLYVLTEGRVAVELSVPNKGMRAMSTIDPGEWFSWSSVLEPWIETANCRAIEPSEALAIRGGALMDLCRDDPKLGFEIFRLIASVIADRLVAATLQVVELEMND